MALFLTSVAAPLLPASVLWSPLTGVYETNQSPLIHSLTPRQCRRSVDQSESSLASRIFGRQRRRQAEHRDEELAADPPNAWPFRQNKASQHGDTDAQIHSSCPMRFAVLRSRGQSAALQRVSTPTHHPDPL